MFHPPLALVLNSPLIRRSGSRSLVTELGEAMLSSDASLSVIVDPIEMKTGNSPKAAVSGQPVGLSRLWSRMQGPIFLFWILLCCKIAMDSVLRMDSKLRNSFFYEAFLYYNPLFLVAMMIWLWGINLRVFLLSRVNYAKVFDLEHTHLTQREIWTIASWMTIIVLTSMTSYLYLYSHGEVSLAASQPVLLYSALPLIMVLPLDVFYMSSRIYFLRTLLRLILPLQPITFADFFVADVLTSMAKVLSDLERATCRMFHQQVATISWFDADSTCGSHSIWIPYVLAFPYMCRFFQCLRQYSDTKDRSCIFNALKYATAFPVIFLSALKYHVLPELWVGIYRPLWLFSSLMNSCFSFYWDIIRDWDLSFFWRNNKSKSTFLRPNLYYSPQWIYHWAIWSNLLLRGSWTYKLSAHLRHNYITVFLMTALEMLRRFQWIFFRVENEWNKMTTRASLQTPQKEMPVETDKLHPFPGNNV